MRTAQRQGRKSQSQLQSALACSLQPSHITSTLTLTLSRLEAGVDLTQSAVLALALGVAHLRAAKGVQLAASAAARLRSLQRRL